MRFDHNTEPQYRRRIDPSAFCQRFEAIVGFERDYEILITVGTERA